MGQSLGHWVEHFPDTQNSPALHFVLQVPQFVRSVPRLTHVLLQLISPLWQDREQMPLEQVCPALHEV